MNEKPTGTITFLFTDIEGSTQLWEDQPDAMKAALERHDKLLREAIKGHNGQVFKTIGDAFCAAFGSASDALEAALTAQRGLHSEKWADAIGTLRIRIALHTGIAEAREGDYFGPPLNRVARLLAASHGGQTLVSHATQELVRDSLPKKTELLDLGEHRLKDLFRPERIFQLNTRGLPTEFPPLRTLDAKLTNLPAQPTPLIGRERELAAVLNLTRREDVRLVTLTGAGGTGKTRLSLQAAADLLDEYEQGVFFVGLASITDPELVIPTIAATLGVKESSGQPIEAALQDYLKDKRLLLVLDNLEQVIQAAPKIGDLLAAAAKLKIITSSREKLRLRGEHEYSVPPLGLPNIKKKETLAAVSQYEAVALFIQRAKAANYHWEITDENAPAVAEICIRLDGLPLAIELAAARSKMLTPQAMLDKLSNRLKALTGGARDLPKRQQTMRDTIEWSYNLLNEGEKTLFARLGVFVGGWSVGAAESVCATVGTDRKPRIAGDPPLRPLPMGVDDGLESLLDKSLIRQTDSASGEVRFTMLEIIREYAVERLDQSDEGEAIRQAHTDFFVALAELVEPELKGPKQPEFLKKLDDDLDNLRAVDDRTHDRGQPEAPLRLGAALERFWWARSQLMEGRQRLERAIKKSEGQPTRLLARANYALSAVAFRQADLIGARPYGDTAIDLYRSINDQSSLAQALNSMGSIYFNSGELTKARAAYEECAAIARALGDRRTLAKGLFNLAAVECEDIQGDLARARAQMEQAAAGLSDVADPVNIAMGKFMLGNILYWQDDFESARARYEQALGIGRKVEYPEGIRYALRGLGKVAVRRGDLVAARQLYQEAMVSAIEADQKADTAGMLTNFALLAAGEGQPRRAAVLLGAEEVARPQFGYIFFPREQAEYERDVAAARAQMDATEFEKAWAEGRAMSLDEAVAFALEEADDAP